MISTVNFHKTLIPQFIFKLYKVNSPPLHPHPVPPLQTASTDANKLMYITNNCSYSVKP